MKADSKNLIILLVIFLVLLITASACGCCSGGRSGAGGGAYRAPSFDSFVVTPQAACIDSLTPVHVAVHWKVDPGNISSEYYYDHCIRISASGELVDNETQCLDAGLESGTSFTLSSIFGTEVPLPVNVLGELCSGTLCSVVNDSASVSIQTQICGDPDITP